MQGSEFNDQPTLVIGAGELGMAVIEALCARGLAADGSLSVLLRPARASEPSGARAQLRDLGLRIIEADLATASVEELARIFRSFSTVVCCTGFVGGAGTQRRITAAVIKAEVDRYIPWQFGVDYDIVGRGSGQEVFDEQSDVRDMLRSQSRTSWIIVSTGMFTSFLFDPAFGVVDLEAAKVHALGSWDNQLTVTTPADIGHLTAVTLAHVPPLKNEIVYVAGDTFTYDRLADIVAEHLGRPVERILWDMAKLRSEAEAHPADPMRKYHLAFARETGVAWDVDRTFNARKNIEVTDVTAWLAERSNGDDDVNTADLQRTGK